MTDSTPYTSSPQDPSKRRYWQVCPRFWSDEHVILWPDDERLLALYLLTCEHRTLEGLFRLPWGYMMADLGWELERVQTALQRLIDEGFAEYDTYGQVMLIPKALLYQPPVNPNQVKSGMKKLASLPETPLIQGLMESAAQYCRPFAEALAERYGIPIPEGLAEPLAEPLPEPLGEPLGESLPQPLNSYLLTLNSKKNLKGKSTGEQLEDEETLDRLAELAIREVRDSESQWEDYRAVCSDHLGRLPADIIESIIYQLAEWEPNRTYRKWHTVLGRWLTKEDPPSASTDDGYKLYTDADIPEHLREYYQKRHDGRL